MFASLPQKTSPSVDAQVRKERVELLYQHGVTTITTGLVVAILLAALMWKQIAHRHIALWLILFIVVATLRYAVVALHARAPEVLSPKRWEHVFTGGAFASGCMWGLATLWMFPSAVEYQLFLCVTGLGLAAGAASSLSAVPRAYLFFLFPAVLPSTVRMLMEPLEIAHIAGLSSIVYCAAMIVIGASNARILRTSLGLRFANMELARDLETRATRDSLTGLSNRLILSERLTLALKRANRGIHDVAIAFVDCDGFKAINDTYGHQIGDEYLQYVARALQDAVREVDTVARLGGDEFIVLLEKCGDKESVERIVQRILQHATRPAVFAQTQVTPRISIGISCYPGDGSDGEALIQQADEAMYLAKREGGNRYRFFTPCVPGSLAPNM